MSTQMRARCFAQISCSSRLSMVSRSGLLASVEAHPRDIRICVGGLNRRLPTREIGLDYPRVEARFLRGGHAPRRPKRAAGSQDAAVGGKRYRKSDRFQSLPRSDRERALRLWSLI